MRATIILLLLIISPSLFCKPIVIKYGQQNTVELMRLFEGVENDFYVDLGAYDAIARSNTVDLYTAGWDGINIDASPTRLSYLLKTRKDQVNLGMAVGEKDKFVTLYEMKHQGSSTISQKMSTGENQKLVQSKVNIVSIGLSTVCQRYFYKTPAFLNLDIEGYGAHALSTNNWTNPKCRPEVVFTELNDANRVTNPKLPGDVLKENNYTLMKEKAGENEIFVANEVLPKYLERKKINSKNLKNYDYIEKQKLELKLRKALSVSKVFSFDNRYFTNDHYDPQTFSVFLLFSKVNRPLDCKFQRIEGKRYQPEGKDRPILVMSYNPHRSGIIVESSNYTISTMDIGEGYELFNLTITPQNQQASYSVYIFNHRHEPKLTAAQLPITVLGTKICSNQSTQPQPLSSEKTDTPTPTKLQNLFKDYSQKQKITSIDSQVTTTNQKLKQIEAKNEESFSKVINLLNKNSHTELTQVKNSLAKYSESSLEGQLQFSKKLAQLQALILKLNSEKVQENIGCDDFLLKVILVQTSILIVLVSGLLIFQWRRKNTSEKEGSSQRVEVADTY